MKTTWKLITVILAGLAYLQPMAHSQSALEASRKIKERADAALNQYRNSLSSTAEDPTKLHELAASAEKCKGELQSLESEIDSQLDFLSKKESGISSSGLADTDRKELVSALGSQKKPLASLKISNLAWKKIFEDFTSTTAKEWQDLYSSFAEIAGHEKAKAKLAERIKSYEAKLPWPGDSGSSLKAEKDQSQSKLKTSTPTSNKISNTSDSGGNASEAIDLAKMNAAAQSSNSAAKAKQLELPEVVASVNGKEITRAQLQGIFNAAVQSTEMKVADLSTAQQLGGYTQLLNDLIDRQLLLEAASKEEVSNEDVEEEIKKFKSQFPDEAIFESQMKQAGMTPEKLQNDVREELKIRRWMESQINAPEVSDADAKSFYESNLKEFDQPETIRASHILFIVDADAPADVVKQKKEAAKKAAARAKAGEDFTTLAKELSEEPGAKESGGDLGYFPEDRMVPEFANAAFALNPDGISEPVKTQFGWHVIKVTDKKAAGTVPFDQVADQITSYLKTMRQREEVQQVMKVLRDNADIKIFI